MKKLIFVLVLLPAILTAQKPYLFTGEMNMQYGGASYLQKFNTDSVSLSTTKKAFSFNKDIYVRGVKLESLSLVDDIFDFQTNKYTPYAAKPTGLGFYTGTEDPNNETRINLNGFFYTTGVYIGSSGSRSIFKYGTFQMLAGSSERLAFNPGVTNTASAVPYLFDTQNSLTGSAKLLSVKNAGVEMFSVGSSGVITSSQIVTGNISGGQTTLTLDAAVNGYTLALKAGTTTKTKFFPNTVDGAIALAYDFDTQNNLTTSGAKLASFKNNGTEKLAIDKDGFISQSWGADVTSATTITPTGPIFLVNGASTIQNINLPYAGFEGSITLIMVDAADLLTGGNIAKSVTTSVNQRITLTYKSSTGLWY